MGPAKGVRDKQRPPNGLPGRDKKDKKKGKGSGNACRYAATRAAKVFIDMLAEKM